jgi:hypothetical protein
LAKDKDYEAKIVQLVLIKEGTYGLEKDLTITYPLFIHGAGQDKTILQGCGIFIAGTKEENNIVDMQDITMKGSSEYGLSASNGLSFLCTRMTFTQCGYTGVVVQETKGRLINCVTTQCKWNGIYCGDNALIELKGCQTKVDGNVTSGRSNYYGLHTCVSSSRIHLLFPLTKESVSTNNGGGGNYGSYRDRGGTIETVEILESL